RLHHHADSPIYRLLLIETDQASIKPESPFSLQERWRSYAHLAVHDNGERFSSEVLRIGIRSAPAQPKLPVLYGGQPQINLPLLGAGSRSLQSAPFWRCRDHGRSRT